MALSTQSLFLYGFQITELNRSIDFRTTLAGAEKHATIPLGFYSLASLLREIVTQLQAADPANTYSALANRAISGGTENRVTISTSGTFLELLFGSGTRAASSIAPLIGFSATDRTGGVSYVGNASAGTRVVTNLAGYNYLGPEFMRKQFGALNISASGLKEAIVFQTQQFFQVQFKFIPKSTFISQWTPMLQWATLQRPLEFTPEISDPSIVHECTIESTSGDGKGLGFTASEMLPQFPNLFDTGMMKFRVRA